MWRQGNYPGIADALNAPTSVENPDAGQNDRDGIPACDAT